jgi:DNA primase
VSVVDLLLTKDLTDYIDGLVPQSDGSSRMRCPLHGGTNPTSFTVFPDTNEFHCWSCGASGNIIEFVMQRDSCEFDVALSTLCNDFNIDLSKDATYVKQRSIADKNEEYCRRFEAKQGTVIDYLRKRGFTDEIIALYRFGWSEKLQALTIPLYDRFGRIVSFSYRYFQGKPKYKHGRNNDLWDKGKFWFNLVNARKLIKRNSRVYLVEGHLDSASGNQMGEAVLAYLGIMPSKDQVLSLKKVLAHFEGVEVVIIPDNDGLAETHIPKVRGLFAKWFPEANLRVAVMKSMDTDGQHIKDLNDLLVSGHTLSEVSTQHIDVYTANYLVSQCTNVEQEYAEAQKFIGSVKSELIKVDICKSLAKRWDQKIEDVRKQLFVTVSAEDEIIGQLSSVSDCIDAYYEMLKHPGYTLGWPSIDASFGKLRKKKVFLIGAFSKVGKSEFIVDILLHSALRLKLRCYVFSMEMEKETFMQRIMCKLFGVTKNRLEEIMLSADGAARILEIQQKLEEYIVIDDTNDLTLEDMKQRVLIANKRVFDKPVDRVFVDYFQYIKGANDYNGISATARAMKPFAKTLNVQLFMLSQFSRSGDQFSEPTISSFRGGNDMESSMDYGILLWRPALDKDMTETEKSHLRYVTKVKLISRDGLLYNEIFSLYYDPKTTRLEEKP